MVEPPGSVGLIGAARSVEGVGAVAVTVAVVPLAVVGVLEWRGGGPAHSYRMRSLPK